MKLWAGGIACCRFCKKEWYPFLFNVREYGHCKRSEPVRS